MDVEFELLADELFPFTLTGDGDSSFDFRFSGLGTRNAVGEVDGVFELPVTDVVLDEDEDEFVEVFVVPVEDEVVEFRPPRPLAPPFRSLL